MHIYNFNKDAAHSFKGTTNTSRSRLLPGYIMDPLLLGCKLTGILLCLSPVRLISSVPCSTVLSLDVRLVSWARNWREFRISPRIIITLRINEQWNVTLSIFRLPWLLDIVFVQFILNYHDWVRRVKDLVIGCLRVLLLAFPLKLRGVFNTIPLSSSFFKYGLLYLQTNAVIYQLKY